jgi:hypothetical protein
MNRVIEWLLGPKVGELAGADNWWVTFIGDWSSYARLALLLVFAAMVYLTVRSYRREGDARPRVKATLAGVRIAVIVLVFIVLFRPAIMLRYVKTLRRSLVVLVDDSLSMSFSDRYADPEQREQLAGLLGVTPEKLAEMSRTEIAQQALTRDGGPVGKLAADHPLMVMCYSTNQPGQEAYTRLLETIEPPENVDETESPDAGIRLAKLLADLKGAGYETDLATALRDVLERTQGQRVAGIVLVSDGRNTARAANGLTGVLLYARQRGVPLYTVTVGDPTPPKNLAIRGFQGPREVRRMARTEFTAMLSHRNLAGESVTVALKRHRSDREEWSDTGVSKTVTLAAATGEDDDAKTARAVQAVTLHHEPDELGEFVYKAVVASRPDERNVADNHSDPVTIRVSDEKINILLVSGDAGYEFQYIKNILYRSPELYRLSVWQQNADKNINQVSSTGMKLARLPQTLEELIGKPGSKTNPGYDVIMLYDPQPTKDGFDEKFVTMLKTFVRNHGGGLCYVAGNKYSESALPSEGPYKSLVDLLPVTLKPNVINLTERLGHVTPQPWQVQLTSYGLDHPVMRLGETSKETEQVWGMLPGIYWSHPVYKAKPVARVLAVHSNPLRLTARRESEPLVAVQPVGSGQVLYVGFDETWRWRFVRDAYYHRRFWANAVRYLASLKARKVVITTGGDRFSAGEKVKVEVEAYDDQYRPIAEETFELVMKNLDDETEETLTLQAVDPENKPGQFTLEIVARSTGRFQLSSQRGGSEGKGDESKRIVVELPQAEKLRVEADQTTMATIASRPEHSLPAREVDKLAGLIPPGRLTTYQDVPQELWDSQLMLLLVVILLVVEWILRKKHNMA